MADVEAVPDGTVSVRPAEAPGPPDDPKRSPGEMSLVGHLTELRNRIIKVVLAVALGSVVGWFLYVPIRNMLLDPLPPGPGGEPAFVQVLAPGDAFAIALRISVIVGIILAMPVILWQIWAFVAPGLTPAEKRTVRPWIPMALLFFALGVGVAYLVLPAAVGFLLSFTDARLVGNLAAGPYFDFVTTIFLAFGVVMEFPIVLFGLSRVNIVTSERLVKARGVALIVIFLFAAGITPGGDPVSMIALGGTMYLLFEGTIFFIRRTGK
ncbi:MAG TPA: twin-arginine translocase subunit TatC [Candidatus Limnocylindrales bacterium]|nr:twin-arginine translocase subunit TatC [Candidatus Limnocylindrales bacterium]